MKKDHPQKLTQSQNPDQPRSQIRAVRFPQAAFEELTRAAARDGVSFGVWVREAALATARSGQRLQMKVHLVQGKVKR